MTVPLADARCSMAIPFHEAAHILLHSEKETFVDDGADDDVLETEANRFAENILIPAEHTAVLASLTTDADVKRFAAGIGIAPESS